jgi:hypothetical protein
MVATSCSVMGWAELQVERLIDTYVKRDEIVLARIAKLDQNTDGTNGANPTAKPAQKPAPLTFK